MLSEEYYEDPDELTAQHQEQAKAQAATAQFNSFTREQIRDMDPTTAMLMQMLGALTASFTISREANRAREEAKAARKEQHEMLVALQKSKQEERQDDKQEKKISEFPRFRDGQDISAYLSSFIHSMDSIKVPVNQWKKVLAKKLPTHSLAKVTSIVEDGSSFYDLKSRLLELEGYSIQETWSRLFAQGKGGKSNVEYIKYLYDLSEIDYLLDVKRRPSAIFA